MDVARRLWATVAPTVDVITPDLRGRLHNDSHRADEFIARGLAAAEAVQPAIEQLRDRLLG